jgi:hypothetical protein
MKYLLPFAALAVASVAQARDPRPIEQPLLLLNKSVQDALKLTDGQKTEMKQIEEHHAVEVKKVEQIVNAHEKRDAAVEAFEKTSKELGKFVEGLSKDQATRYKQIRVQMKGIYAFAEEGVAMSLKLTDKQKGGILTLTNEMEKVRRQMSAEAGRNQEKLAEARMKVAELNSQAMDMITGDFSDEQKNTWMEITGDKFEWKANPPAAKK